MVAEDVEDHLPPVGKRLEGRDIDMDGAERAGLQAVRFVRPQADRSDLEQHLRRFIFVHGATG